MKTLGKLCQYCGDMSNDILTNSETLKFKIKLKGKPFATGNTKDVKIAVPLKYLSNFWRTLEMSLTNCETDCVYRFLLQLENNRYFVNPR